MRGKVTDSGTNGHRRGVDGARYHLRGARQSEHFGKLRAQRADNIRGADQLRQFASLDSQRLDQAVVVADAMGIAVVGDPCCQHRVAGGAIATRQAQVHVVEHIEKLVGSLIALRLVIKDVSHVPGGIHARQRGHAPGQAQRTPEFERPVPGQAEPPSSHALFDRACAPLVQPQHRTPNGNAVLIHTHRSFALCRTTHRDHLAPPDGVGAEQFVGAAQKGIPPILRFLLDAQPAHMQRYTVKRPRPNLAFQ